MAATMPRQIRTMTIKLSRPSLIALAVSMSALSGGFTFAAEGMDISTMGRGSMPLDHSKMGHGAMQEQMEGMDHSNMDHSQMNHGSPRTTSRTPIPVLTDADRQAAFAPLPGHTVHDSGINSFFLLDQLEYHAADEGSPLAWRSEERRVGKKRVS